MCVVCTARMEIRTGIDLKRTKLAMDLNLREEVTESTPVADAASHVAGLVPLGLRFVSRFLSLAFQLWESVPVAPSGG